GEVDGKTGCAGGIDERKRKSQGKHGWPQSRSSDGGSGSRGPLESVLHSWFGRRNADGRTIADNAGRFKGVLPGIDRGAGSDRSRNPLGWGAGRDHRVGTRGRSPEFCATLKRLALSIVRRRSVDKGMKPEMARLTLARKIAARQHLACVAAQPNGVKRHRSMKPSSRDQLGLASPLNYAAIQSGNIKSPFKKEAGLDVSHHALVSRDGRGENLFLTSSFIARHSRNQNTLVSFQLSAVVNRL